MKEHFYNKLRYILENSIITALILILFSYFIISFICWDFLWFDKAWFGRLCFAGIIIYAFAEIIEEEHKKK